MIKKFIPIVILSALPLLAAAQSRTLTLEECKRLSSENDPYVKGAALDVLAARAQKQEVFTEYFPKVSATALAFHSLNPLIDIGVTDILGHSDYAWEISNAYHDLASQNGLPTRYKALQYGYGVTLSAMQPLYAGGRIVNGNRLAALGVEAAQLKENLTRSESAQSIEKKFWQIVSIGEKLKTLSEAEQMLISLKKDADAAFAAGILTQSDLLQLELKTNELKSLRLQASSGMKLAKMDLFNAIGLPYSYVRAASSVEKPYLDDIELSGDLDALQSPDHYYIPEEEMVASMAQTRLLSLQLEAKNLEKKLSMGEALPQVAIGATAGYAHYIGDAKLNAGVYAMVQIPISDWGKTSKKMRRIDYDIQKTAIEKDYLDAQLLLLARQLWLTLESTWEQVQVAKEGVEIAQDALRRSKDQLDAGMITMSDFLQTQTSLRQSEDSYTDQRIAYVTALGEYLSKKTR